jgi:hypothetical protein
MMGDKMKTRDEAWSEYEKARVAYTRAANARDTAYAEMKAQIAHAQEAHAQAFAYAEEMRAAFSAAQDAAYEASDAEMDSAT